MSAYHQFESMGYPSHSAEVPNLLNAESHRVFEAAVCPPVESGHVGYSHSQASACATSSASSLAYRTLKAHRRTCSVAGCKNGIVQGGLCVSHGAKRRLCRFPGCTKNSKNAGLCSKHGPARKKCEHPGCSNVAVRGGKCKSHGAWSKSCSVEGCTKVAAIGGMCKRHNFKAKNAPPSSNNNIAAVDASAPVISTEGHFYSHGAYSHHNAPTVYGTHHNAPDMYVAHQSTLAEVLATQNTLSEVRALATHNTLSEVLASQNSHSASMGSSTGYHVPFYSAFNSSQQAAPLSYDYASQMPGYYNNAQRYGSNNMSMSSYPYSIGMEEAKSSSAALMLGLGRLKPSLGAPQSNGGHPNFYL